MSAGYCDNCQNTGEIDCLCGGDMCICGQIEIECPKCHGKYGEPDPIDDPLDQYGDLDYEFDDPPDRDDNSLP